MNLKKLRTIPFSVFSTILEEITQQPLNLASNFIY